MRCSVLKEILPPQVSLTQGPFPMRQQKEWEVEEVCCGHVFWEHELTAMMAISQGYLTRPQIQQEWDFEKGFSLVFQAGFQLECNTLQVSYLFWSLASVWKISDVKSITVTWIYIFYTWTVLLQWILCVGYHCILTVVLNKIIFSKVVY